MNDNKYINIGRKEVKGYTSWFGVIAKELNSTFGTLWSFLAVIALLFASVENTKAQDLNFTQFYELPLLRNPALAGEFVGDVRVQSVYRNQWQAVTVPYRTGGLSAEVNFPVNEYGHYLTAGTQLLYDVAGDSKLTRTHILPVLGYHAPIIGSDVYLSGAIMGGVVSSNFDPTKLRWDDQFIGGSYNPTNPTRQLISATARTYFDIGAGLAISGPATESINFYLGSAVYHANSPNIAFDNEDIRLGRKWAFNGGLSIETSDWNRLTLYADYFMQKAAISSDSIARLGRQNTFMLGAFYTSDLNQYDLDDVMSLTFGAVYRLNDAIAPVVRFDVKKFGIGLSYDVNVSSLTKASQGRGGFELTLGFKTDFTRRKVRSYRMECVDFVR